MKNEKAFIVIWLLIIVANVGVWLMGAYGIEVRIGSQVLGRRVNLIEEEMPISWYLGLIVASCASFGLLVRIYRKR